MNIATWILTCEIGVTAKRLEGLKNLQAPTLVIDAAQAQLDKLRAGEIAINDKANLLNLEFSSAEWKTGRGGKPFAEFATAQGTVYYFPKGKFGKFISQKSE